MFWQYAIKIIKILVAYWTLNGIQGEVESKLNQVHKKGCDKTLGDSE